MGLWVAVFFLFVFSLALPAEPAGHARFYISYNLNKRLKVYEADHTNQSADRFRSTLFHFRVGMLHFPHTLCKEVVSKVKCTACGAFGHNRKNKACPSRVDSRAEQHLDLAESGED